MPSHRTHKSSFCLLLLATLTINAFQYENCFAKDPLGKPWQMHVIDNSSRGADGVKLADINADGLLDIATGWEEGGLTKVYLHPGHEKAKSAWPAVTIGKTPNVEDAVFADLDADGALDVISCCEGKQQSIFIHWAPKQPQQLLDPQAWQQQILPDSVEKTRWMFAWPMQVDGKNGIDLIAGSKKPNGQIGWYETPANPRDLENYIWHPISPAGWVMSLWQSDMDADGDIDIVVTDRYLDNQGCRWLENPGPCPAQTQPWPSHYLDDRQHEVLSMGLHDWDQDGLEDALVAVKDHKVLFHKRLDTSGKRWQTHIIPADFNAGNTRAVAVADLNLDGHQDLAITTWNAKDLHGLLWLEAPRPGSTDQWQAHQISGTKQGKKFDRLELFDIDGDGDQDLLTCEEQHNGAGQGLGVIWYENPSAPKKRKTVR